jgi:hypothetical protein
VVRVECPDDGEAALQGLDVVPVADLRLFLLGLAH